MIPAPQSGALQETNNVTSVMLTNVSFFFFLIKGVLESECIVETKPAPNLPRDEDDRDENGNGDKKMKKKERFSQT